MIEPNDLVKAFSALGYEPMTAGDFLDLGFPDSLSYDVFGTDHGSHTYRGSAQPYDEIFIGGLHIQNDDVILVRKTK